MESKNPERDATIIALHHAGCTDGEIGRRFRIGATRVRQIILRYGDYEEPDIHQRYRLRAEAMACWHKTGMTYKAIGERYSLTGGRVSQIIEKYERRLYRDQKYGPTRRVRRIATVTGLQMKPGAVWHTWYLDPNRRGSE